jgi:prepilin-type N-terminal cleavage/methylation domain-containing protein
MRCAGVRRPTWSGPKRRGFTLVEVVTALTLTAIVIAIAASALASASDAREVIERHQQTLEAESRWRSTVTDMLRHAPPADAVDEPLLRVSRSARSVRLTFLSVGVVQPFGTGRIWRVTIGTDSDGLQLDAEPIGTGQPAARLHTTLTHLHGFDVAVLESATGPALWRGDWPVERSRPALVRLSFADADVGADAGTSGPGSRGAAPLYVQLAPLAPPNGNAAGTPP